MHTNIVTSYSLSKIFSPQMSVLQRDNSDQKSHSLGLKLLSHQNSSFHHSAFSPSPMASMLVFNIFLPSHNSFSFSLPTAALPTTPYSLLHNSTSPHHSFQFRFLVSF